MPAGVGARRFSAFALRATDGLALSGTRMTEDDGSSRDDAAAKEPGGLGDRRIPLPENRLIRKRVAARTTAIHVSALAGESWAQEILEETGCDRYLEKRDFPDELEVFETGGSIRIISRDEAWTLADKKGAALEWVLLSGVSGRIAAYFSTHGQGVYANYGRPTLDFAGFFRDHLAATTADGAAGRATINLRIGPLFIAADTATAAGLTALGHFARGANLASAPVASDVLSTGAYEGTSAWATAKLGVLTGAKAVVAAAALPLPGACLAALMAGFAVGAVTAIAAKHAANLLKDKAIDAACQAADRRALHERAARPVTE